MPGAATTTFSTEHCAVAHPRVPGPSTAPSANSSHSIRFCPDPPARAGWALTGRSCDRNAALTWYNGRCETKTEPRAWGEGPPPTGPGTCRTVPRDCRSEPGWAIVGNRQDLPNGYEARSMVIADSECMADCRPSLTAPNADSVALSEWPRA